VPEHVVVDGTRQLEGALVDAPVGEHHDEQHDLWRKADELHRSHGRCRRGRADDHRGLVGQARQQVRGLGEHVLDLAVGRVEERAHPGGRVATETGRRACQLVDEGPVALLCRDPTGAGVRLAEVAVLFEQCHVVADGGRRDVDAGRARDVTRAHRLGRLDVLLHHGSEDRCLALVEHAGSLAERVAVVAGRKPGAGTR